MIDTRSPHTYSAVFRELRARVGEAAPGRVQILTGPRQVGKTHLLLALSRELGGRAVYAAADTPAAALAGWWEAQWRRAEAVANPERPAVLMIDEIQHLPDWSVRLKAEYDRMVREGLPVHVIVSGSSSLRLGSGARESMAGRFERHRLLHWPPAELVRWFGMNPDRAVETMVRYGSYPGAVDLLGDPERWRHYVLDSIVEPAIGRDILAMESIRKPALLRQILAVAAGHPAEVVSLQKLRLSLTDRGALETVAHYLGVLEEAYLVAALAKVSRHEIRRRSAPPKLVVLNQGILAAMTAEGPPSPDGDPARWGRWVENACIAHAWNAGQTVRYWRAAPLEVDMTIEGSWGRCAVEVKTGRYTTADLAGLLELCRRNRDLQSLVLCDRGRESVAREAGVKVMSWQYFLLHGPSEGGG
ncbi:MAG: ATP-binding protein [Planctomycetes bacterium]|nr:ATP-binding protein [Planctomycetota bacterium]